jgi:acrylyl-CoA reductase (NADPH)
MSATQFTCYLVEKNAAGELRQSVTSRKLDELPPGEVLIRVRFSSLNYKDALASQANPAVVRRLPHVPGIDAAGEVVESSNSRFQPGQQVVVTGYELGAGEWGGWSQYVRVPADWVVPLPEGLSLYESMVLGTAGFTAAQCANAIQLNHVPPDAGEVVVTGSTGGVGCLAVLLLAKLGYTVVAVTGKRALENQLRQWGAGRVVDRSEVVKQSDKPLLTGRWASAVDTVGGQTLATLLRETENYGVVAACGLVGGVDLPLTVHPFILRGVTLAGISSVNLPYDRRIEIWRKLSHEWRIEGLERVATTIRLEQLDETIAKILRGEIVGRTVVELP